MSEEVEVEVERESEVLLDHTSIILEMLEESMLPLKASEAAASEQATLSC